MRKPKRDEVAAHRAVLGPHDRSHGAVPVIVLVAAGVGIADVEGIDGLVR